MTEARAEARLVEKHPRHRRVVCVTEPLHDRELAYTLYPMLEGEKDVGHSPLPEPRNRRVSADHLRHVRRIANGRCTPTGSVRRSPPHRCSTRPTPYFTGSKCPRS